MSTTMNINSKLHEARSEQIKGNYQESLSLYVTVMDMLETAMETCTPQEKEYYSTMMNNTVAEYELVSNHASKQTSFPKRAPSAPAFPYATVPMMYGYVTARPPVGPVVHAFPVASSYTTANIPSTTINRTQPPIQKSIPQPSTQQFVPQPSTQPSAPQQSAPQPSIQQSVPQQSSQPSSQQSSIPQSPISQSSTPQSQGVFPTVTPPPQSTTQATGPDTSLDPTTPQLAVETINLPAENKNTSCACNGDNFFIRLQKRIANWLKKTPWANSLVDGIEKAATILATGVVAAVSGIIQLWNRLLTRQGQVPKTAVPVHQTQSSASQ